MTQDVRSRLAAVRERIAAAAARAGRDPASVTLVAVSKGVEASRIERGLFPDLGENRVDELLDKALALGDEAVRWHFVGSLQRNKAARVAGRAHLIHSLDSERLATALARAADEAGAVQDVLVQVNVSGEKAKHGVAVDEAVALARAADAMPGLRVLGFMTMAPASSAETARVCFAGLRAVRDRARAVLPEAKELSMGMSGDFEIAVEEGATIVRVGTAIFGPRAPR